MKSSLRPQEVTLVVQALSSLSPECCGSFHTEMPWVPYCSHESLISLFT